MESTFILKGGCGTNLAPDNARPSFVLNVSERLLHTLVHDTLGQHLGLEDFPDELGGIDTLTLPFRMV